MFCLQVRILSEQGVKEVTLLGQNVNSYADTSALMEMLTKPKADAATDPFAIYAQVTFSLITCTSCAAWHPTVHYQNYLHMDCLLTLAHYSQSHNTSSLVTLHGIVRLGHARTGNETCAAACSVATSSLACPGLSQQAILQHAVLALTSLRSYLCCARPIKECGGVGESKSGIQYAEGAATSA